MTNLVKPICDAYGQPVGVGSIVGYTRNSQSSEARSYICRVVEIVQVYQWEGLLPCAGRVRIEFIRDAYAIMDPGKMPRPIVLDTRSLVKLPPEIA